MQQHSKGLQVNSFQTKPLFNGIVTLMHCFYVQSNHVGVFNYKPCFLQRSILIFFLKLMYIQEYKTAFLFAFLCYKYTCESIENHSSMMCMSPALDKCILTRKGHITICRYFNVLSMFSVIIPLLII